MEVCIFGSVATIGKAVPLIERRKLPMEKLKEEYVAPELIVYGNVEEITQGGRFRSADSPQGINNGFSNR